MDDKNENNVNKPLGFREIPKIKMLKLKNGETVVAMVEANEEQGFITLYNPFKLAINNELMSENGKVPVLMEEWLPTQIVLEQVCQIFVEDVLTMVDVNDRFVEGYTRSVMRRVQLTELVRRATTSAIPDSATGSIDPNALIDSLLTGNDMLLDENGEGGDDEIDEAVAKKLKKLRDEFN